MRHWSICAMCRRRVQFPRGIEEFRNVCMRCSGQTPAQLREQMLSLSAPRYENPSCRCVLTEWTEEMELTYGKE